ncbi:AsmA family protein [Vibrio sp. SM6]|uniref:AsmA family protein n=1 Tax=Vibrio agarilyticus TaxID=2726741 RepID=A0A7X8TTE9_9VIBR|nr:AsmA family protein [Vibrio agarilyticus]NLS14463.1 AsmA family protein [Vibrio agarilyticus]
MMKKLLVTFALLISLTLLSVITLVALLPTKAGTHIANHIVKQLDWSLSAEQYDYHFPNQLTLHQVSFAAADGSSTPLQVTQVDLWLASWPYQDGQWQLDSLLIKGATVSVDAQTIETSQGDSPLNAVQTWRAKLEHVAIAHLALSEINIITPQQQIEQLSVQIRKPQWLNSTQYLPYGDIQFSANQIRWNDERISQPLFDFAYRPHDSTLYGASFTWRGAQFSGQAEQYPSGWSLVNVTVEGLQLTQSPPAPLTHPAWQWLLAHVSHINSLDILRSDISWQAQNWRNLNLSVENIALPLRLWQQSNASLSFTADSLSVDEQMWVEPRAHLTLNEETLTLHDMAANWQQGLISTQGLITPTRIHLDDLTISNVQWTLDKHQSALELPEFLAHYSDWHFDNLAIKHSQLIQLADKPYWQVSGLNVTASDLTLKQAGKWGMWQGRAELSAANASFDQLLTHQPLITMESERGLWRITRAFAPLELGYVDMTAEWNLAKLSRPWQLNLNVEGLPVASLLSLPYPLSIESLSSGSVDLQGLGGDWNMLSHTLSGEITAELYQSKAKLVKAPWRSVSISPIKLKAERGRITLPKVTLATTPPVADDGENIEAWWQGELDLAAPEQSTLRYQIQGVATPVITTQDGKSLPTAPECFQWRGMVWDPRSQVAQPCAATQMSSRVH